MLDKIPMMLLILFAFILLTGCKDESKQQAKKEPQTVQMQPTPEQIEQHRKATESRYKPSEKKEWKPF